MGVFMGDDDMYIESLLETLNLHFGSFVEVQDAGKDTLEAVEKKMRLHMSGVLEIQAIQAEFEIFKAGRPLVQSLRALGVGGQWNPALKRKWFKLLNRLDNVPSSDPQLSGGQAIVAALVRHLQPQNTKPDPVHFKAHDARTQPQVLILQKDRPIFYIATDFLTISLPMTPRSAQASPGP